MKPNAVLFDLDGTLIDSLADIGHAVNRILKQYGLPIHDLNAYRYFIGDGVAKLIARALPEDHRHEALIESCRQAFIEDYSRNWKVHTNVYNQIPELLDELTRLGIRMAILSNKPQHFTELCVNEFLSKWTFEAVMGHRPSFPPKPDPSGAIEIARIMNLPVSEVVYIGDSGVDMRTAVSAGMFPVGALWGFRSRDELESSGAKVVIASPMELLRFMVGRGQCPAF